MLKSTLKKYNQSKGVTKRYFARIVDTFVVGGDAPGLATAWALSKSLFFIPDNAENKRIVVLDDSDVPDLNYYKHANNSKVPDQNLVTISFTTLQLLKSLGALDKMNHMLITPYRKLFVNEKFGKSYLAFDDEIIDKCLLAKTQQGFYDEYISKHNYHFSGKNSLGVSVENNHIKSAFYDILNEQNKTEIIKNDKIRYIRPATSLSHLSEIELESGKRFKAKLIIGNDGRTSYTRNQHDIEWSRHTYNQKCIVKLLMHEEPLSGAFQRFLPSGPIAILPLWKNYSFWVWSCATHLADELMELSHEDLIKEINNQFYSEPKYEFGAFFDRFLPSIFKNIEFELPARAVHNKESQKLKSFSFSLEALNAEVHAKDRVALVGTAATTLHPITGHGYNFGMTGAALLANAIISQSKSGGDIGSYETCLKSFAIQTKKNEKEAQAIQEMFKKGYLDTVFGSESIGRAMSLARNCAVDLIDTVPILKYNMVFYAAGLTNHPTAYEWDKEF